MRFPSPRFTSNPWYWAAAVVMVAYLVLGWVRPHDLVWPATVGVAAVLLICVGLARERRRG